MQCLAMTQKGNQCGNTAIYGRGLCHVHKSDYRILGHLKQQIRSTTESLSSLGYGQQTFWHNIDIPDPVSGEVHYRSLRFRGTSDTKKKRLARWKLQSILKKEQLKDIKPEIEKQESQARKLLYDRQVLQVICKVLQEFSGDVFDIVKTITPVLVGAALAGTVPLPLNPLLFSLIGFMIARVGIKSICAKVHFDE